MEKMKIEKNTIKLFSDCLLRLVVLLFCVFRAVLNDCFCTVHFVMVFLNLTCLHCLQHFFL